jgi:Domain of unknown function (DUF6316)
MSRKRKDDPLERIWFRTDRLLEDRGKWYFLTREATVQGPFDCRSDALERLETYTKVIESGILEHDFEARLLH